MLLRSQERIEELEERAQDAELALARHEEASTCLIWILSSCGKPESYYVLGQMLEEAYRFGVVDVEPGWLASS